MTKVQAIELTLKGKRVQHVSWPKYKYYYYDFSVDGFRDECGDFYNVNEFYIVDSWKEYKEPVTKHRWIFCVNDNLIISPEYYANEKELRANIVSKCDWCEPIKGTAMDFYND